MKQFKDYFFSIMDRADKRGFIKYLVVMFIGSIFSVLGVGAMLPVIHLLISPDHVMSFKIFSSLNYYSVVMILVGCLILAFVVKNLITFKLSKYQAKFMFGLVSKIQIKLFTQYMRSSYTFHLERKTPDLIKVIVNETQMFTTSFMAPLGVCITEVLASLFIVVFLLILSPVFTILVAAFLVLAIFIFMKRIKKKARHYGYLRSTSWSKMTKEVMSGFSSIKESKLYHCEDNFIDEFSESSQGLKQANVFSNLYAQAPRLLIETMGVIVIMCVTGFYIISGYDLQKLIVILGVFGVAAAQLLPSMNRLSQALVSIRYAFPALEKIAHELSESKPNGQQQFSSTQHVRDIKYDHQISLRHVSYTYADGTRALNNLSMSIEKGLKVALVGPSGAGKTTLVDLILRLYQQQAGTIHCDDLQINQDNTRDFQALFAYIPQQIVLFDSTIAENIAFGVMPEEIDLCRVKECLRLSHLTAFVNALADKEQTVIGESGVKLSGGQRQRVGIARALYRNPKILVMDEATSALDNQTEYEVVRLLAELKLTVVTIAHRISTIKHYDKIYVMKDGRVISEGRYNELKDACTVFKTLIKEYQFMDQNDQGISS